MRQFSFEGMRELQFSERTVSSNDIKNIFGENEHSHDPARREQEVDIHYNFTNAIEAIGMNECLTIKFNVEKVTWAVESVDESVDEEDNAHVEAEGEAKASKSVTLEDVCKFITGSKYPMKSMLGKGSVRFKHFDTKEEADINRGARMVANTCAYSVEFPVTTRYTTGEDTFIQNIMDDILCSPGFGRS